MAWFWSNIHLLLFCYEFYLSTTLHVARPQRLYCGWKTPTLWCTDPAQSTAAAAVYPLDHRQSLPLPWFSPANRYYYNSLNVLQAPPPHTACNRRRMYACIRSREPVVDRLGGGNGGVRVVAVSMSVVYTYIIRTLVSRYHIYQLSNTIKNSRVIHILRGYRHNTRKFLGRISEQPPRRLCM